MKTMEKNILAEVKRRLGRDFVSLVLIGSRATGEALPESDVDAFAFTRGTGRKLLTLPGLGRRHGIRIGISAKPLSELTSCSAGHGKGAVCSFDLVLLSFACGKARVIGGRDVLRTVPSVRAMLRRDLKTALRRDVEASIEKNSPSNVLRREPRRQVGFIIAMSEQLLLIKGVAVPKTDLPKALRRRYPKFRDIPLLERALWRRANWKAFSSKKSHVRDAYRDLLRFLEAFRRYL